MSRPSWKRPVRENVPNGHFEENKKKTKRALLLPIFKKAGRQTCFVFYLALKIITYMSYMYKWHSLLRLYTVRPEKTKPRTVDVLS